MTASLTAACNSIGVQTLEQSHKNASKEGRWQALKGTCNQMQRRAAGGMPASRSSNLSTQQRQRLSKDDLEAKSALPRRQTGGAKLGALGAQGALHAMVCMPLECMGGKGGAHVYAWGWVLLNSCKIHWFTRRLPAGRRAGSASASTSWSLACSPACRCTAHTAWLRGGRGAPHPQQHVGSARLPRAWRQRMPQSLATAPGGVVPGPSSHATRMS